MKSIVQPARHAAFGGLLILAVACAPAQPARRSTAPKPKPVPESIDVGPIADAPWRGEGSQAAGHEPKIGKTPAILFRGARLLIGDGTEVNNGHVLIKDGKIESAGAGEGTPNGARVIDAKGKTITPGLVDTHSHMGVYAMPRARAHSDGNEMTTPVTPDARAIDAFWPQDPSIQRAVAGGTTTVQVLPGSGNLIGGRAVTLKLRPALYSREMHFEGARDGLKMACGENPKRVYGGRKQKPSTRMGNLAVQRDAFLRAKRLIEEWDQWRAKERMRREKLARAERRLETERADRDRKRRQCARRQHPDKRCRRLARRWSDKPLRDPEPSIASLQPKRDIGLETLAAVLEGNILVHIHCYRADDMHNMLKLADEMGFAVRSFHHALEAYKMRKDLAKRKIGVSTWADWWGFKMEAYDGIPHNLALVSDAGGIAIVHSDSAEGVRRLNQEASKGMWTGRHAGIRITEAEAIKWITLNPAWALGVESRIGSLEVGKDADIVVWDRNPFSVYARPVYVFIDGKLRFDSKKPSKPWSDFEAGVKP